MESYASEIGNGYSLLSLSGAEASAFLNWLNVSAGERVPGGAVTQVNIEVATRLNDLPWAID